MNVVVCICVTEYLTAFYVVIIFKKYRVCIFLHLKSWLHCNAFILQEADMEFVSSLASLLKTIERAIQVHEDFSGVMNPAELLECHFTGIKVIVQQNNYFVI